MSFKGTAYYYKGQEEVETTLKGELFTLETLYILFLVRVRAIANSFPDPNLPLDIIFKISPIR